MVSDCLETWLAAAATHGPRERWTGLNFRLTSLICSPNRNKTTKKSAAIAALPVESTAATGPQGVSLKMNRKRCFCCSQFSNHYNGQSSAVAKPFVLAEASKWLKKWLKKTPQNHTVLLLLSIGQSVQNCFIKAIWYGRCTLVLSYWISSRVWCGSRHEFLHPCCTTGALIRKERETLRSC